MRILIQLAQKNIEIISKYEYIKSISKRFLIDCNHIDFSVAPSDEDILFELRLDGVSSSLSYQEAIAVYRKIADAMLAYNTFLMHGCVIAVNEECFMITASSGVGKTTRANTWLKTIPNSHILNGDKPLIKISDGQVFACGTPWCGKENQGTNEILPLKAIFFLERSEENSVTEIPFSEAFIPLLKQTYRPQSADKMKQTLHLLNELKGKVRFFRFCSNLDEEAVKMAYAAATSAESTPEKQNAQA